MKMKALDIMKTSSNTEQRAETYVGTIKRNLQKNLLDPLIDKKEKLEDTVTSLLDFSLQTDINKGVAMVTREEAEDRFAKVMQKEYELVLLNLEIKAKQASFDKYFTDADEA